MVLMKDREHIQRALDREGITGTVQPLGEGAWHMAYLIEEKQLVLRIPKKIAYDKEVEFNPQELTAEYAATKAFYEHANRAKKGICPEYFDFYVSEELTYTIESYVGESIGLGHQTIEEAKQYGRELGECFRLLETLDPPFAGMGYVELDEKGQLKGPYEMNAEEFLVQETDEYLSELDTLLASSYSFDKEKVERTGRQLLAERSIKREKVVFTNQDTSPENILFSKNGAKMIDPFPLLATGTSLAANHVFNYTMLFPKFADTERFGKGDYHIHAAKLKANAEGFTESYTDGSEQKQKDLHIEVFIKLLTMAFEHHQLLEEKTLNREQIIRYGTKKQVEERLQGYLQDLESYLVL
ncbi:hypothetical protein H0266_13755 [Halobacillus locisalis]|uniref:Aminoglycoside phosphotransferase domain-containing protein n=1 Tax=Halobacillus locisalis TaxID=220753 RepID=A0A838CVK0_9BACI|nr:hypothetical protein [Halobacillus locisalis]MBA2175958.1 hypothetical protein [Halobacillus locisalis]